MWKEGTIKVNDSIFSYWVKHFEVGSEYGIDNGRISKLELKRKGETVVNYDRGWDIRPVDEDSVIALEILMYDYN